MKPPEDWRSPRTIVQVTTECVFCRKRDAHEFRADEKFGYGPEVFDRRFGVRTERPSRFLWWTWTVREWEAMRCTNCGHAACVEVERTPILARDSEVSIPLRDGKVPVITGGVLKGPVPGII